ncbi:MAG: SDR family oxidoreductase [Planctomycetota bacterium]|nr:MAG: SDR family oxidoreductase [Planctomycetota bacterium]
MSESTTAPVALVTGSGKRRVGNTVLRRLAERGFDTVLHYRSSTNEAEATAQDIRTAGGRCEAIQADVSVETDVVRMFQTIRDRFGRLDVVVNCASVWEPKPLEETTAEDVERQFRINTLGTFLCCREAGKIMAAQPEGGLIVLVGDWAVARPYLNYAAYFASKGAIPTLTRMFAVELASRNPRIRVNCIEPGPVMLPDHLRPSERRYAVEGTLLKREGSPENVAQAVLAFWDNDYVTGVCLPVDAGRRLAAYDADRPA